MKMIVSRKQIWRISIPAVFLLVFLLLFPGVINADTDPVAEGTCGEGVTWSVSDQGVLTIESNLENSVIDDIDWPWHQSWRSYGIQIKEINIRVHGNLTIGENAFSNLESVEIVSISPDCVITSVRDNAFNSCFALTEIENSQNIRQIGVCSFNDCRSLETIDLSQLENVKIPQAFEHCESLKEVRIPATVEEIGSFAFYDCYQLERVIFEGNSQLKAIGGEAFFGCESLNHFVLPEGVTRIEDGTFQGCRSLSDFSGIDHVTSIGDNAFASTAITELTVPSAIRTLPLGCFGGCEQLETVDLNHVTVLEGEVFSGCSSLKNIKNLEKVKKIGDGAFGNCSSLTEFTFPEKVKTAPFAVLTNCTSLQSLNLNNVKRIELLAFSNCKNLKTITHNGLITSVGEGAFQNCPKIKEFWLPYGTETIAINAFSGCTKLKKIYIPKSVTDIDYEAFLGVHALSIFTDHTKKSAKGIFEDLDTLDDDNIKVYYGIAPEASPVGSFVRLQTKITLVSKIVNYNNKVQKIGKAKITGSSGKVTYTYYRNKACTKQTTVKQSGAKKKGGAPKYPGTYYVKVAVKKDSYYKKATSKPIPFIIQPKISFSWKQYPGYDFIFPKITGLKWVKSYYVELYNGRDQLLRKSKTYTEAMKFGIRPGAGSGAEDIYQSGQKYKVKIIFSMKDGSKITVESKYKKKN